MGVKGLTTFVNQYQHQDQHQDQHQHQQFFKDHRLHTTELVIDGYGIMPKLYCDRTVDPGNHGGEFQKFYDHCAHFCKNLHHFGIKPYVVFDGAYDMDGKKDETLKERHQQKIDDVCKINNRENVFIMPTMANEVFKKVLRDFRVPFAFCDFEADRDIAFVANAFECPVLGQDSDFFIMDIKKGYIPFDEFKWSDPFCESRNWIKCKRYQMNKFCDHFQVESCLMPLFASVCGNDYRKPLPLAKFFHATKHRNQREPDERPHPRHICEGDTKFCEVLHHLTYYQTYRECLEVIVKQVPHPERATTELALRASCDMYEVFNESPIVKFFEGEDADLSTNLLVRDHGVPASFVRLLRQGEVPMICLVIYLNRKCFFGTQVEKIREMRSSYCSQDLLRVLAGIMLVDAAQESKSKGEALTINIYDRNNRQVKCFKVEPLCEIPLFGKVPSFRRISNTSKHQRRLLLLACLEAKDINLNGIPEQFQLVLVVTVYWLRHAQQDDHRNLLVALVLGWIQGVAWCLRKNKLHRLDEGLNPIYSLPNHESVFNNFSYLAETNIQKSLNLDASHSLAQWLACICSAEDINALLMQVFPRADMTVFFNGLLIHNLYYALQKDEELIDKLLPGTSHGRKLYDRLMKFLSSNYEVEELPNPEDQWQVVQ